MDPYKILGLQPGATSDEVDRQHRRLCKLYHPDVSSLDKATAAKKFMEVHAAYESITSGVQSQPKPKPRPQRREPRDGTPVRSVDFEALDAFVRAIFTKHKIPPDVCGRLDFHDKQCLVFYDWAGGEIIDRPISFQRDAGPVVYFDWSRAAMSAIDVLHKWNDTFPSLFIAAGGHAGRPRVVASGVLRAMRTLKQYHDDPDHF